MSNNIKDVAKEAGVAISTVSKVLNNYPGVSEASKKKVLKAVHKLNYTPNRVASALSSKTGNRIGLVMIINKNYQAIDELNMQYLLGAISAAHKLKIEVIPIFSSFFEGLSKEETLQYFSKNQISSLVLYGMSRDYNVFHDIIKEERFSVVVVDAPFINDKTSSIMINHTKAQYEIAEMAIKDTSAKSILYLAGDENGYVTTMRINGIKGLMDRHNLTIDIEYADFSERLAYTKVLASKKAYDLIICASDLMAIGAMNAAKEKGINPTITGYDGITLLSYIPTEIKTVKQNFFQISYEAVHEVNQINEGKEGEPIYVAYEIGTRKYEDIFNN
ncbi:LacI family DNA-binding transcriptional regulator [Erysipelothrix urinaevulpis]|uniref:LacI family DNA-binding transcriptional regulator n=1 Tax=Erysipelothrix urinaevulpis TaxID=2683717 RepID=UPI001357CE06|nr:LacI family DNA-binding transcriptional regulator [Erysipelothrix urinaevulpis]